MAGYHFIHFLTLFAASACGQSLLAVLEDNGFTDYAALIQEDARITAAQDVIVYAPPNAALGPGNGTITRRDTDEYEKKAELLISNVNMFAFSPSLPDLSPTTGNNSTNRVRLRDELVPPGSVFSSLLDDPDFVNLGSGVSQKVVQKHTTSSGLPLLLSGLGAAVKITGDDIPFDNGVIRPVSGLPTLPESASRTLPHLAAESFLDALNKTGLLAELDARTGPITILAPDDNAFKGRDFTPDQLTELVKRHVIVDYFAYTPLLENGYVYPTLGGGEVAVSVDAKGALLLGGARVLAGDAIITNGAIHTISKILDTQAPPPPIVTGAASTVMGLSRKTLFGTTVGAIMAAKYLNIL